MTKSLLYGNYHALSWPLSEVERTGMIIKWISHFSTNWYSWELMVTTFRQLKDTCQDLAGVYSQERQCSGYAQEESYRSSQREDSKYRRSLGVILAQWLPVGWPTVTMNDYTKLWKVIWNANSRLNPQFVSFLLYDLICLIKMCLSSYWMRFGYWQKGATDELPFIIRDDECK